MIRSVTAAPVITDSVVADAVAGDTAAFSRIVRAHHDDMVRVCQVIAGDVELAQDAAQAAWPIAWRRLGTLREPSALRPWLVTIAANEARRMLRSQRRAHTTDLASADVALIDLDPAQRDPDLDLIASVQRLDADDRRMLALRYVAGFDATEIGKAIGMTPSGVQSRLARAVERLRREVDRG
jgi:RNA polymerase sigma-70 factor (ECF subfamily)